MISSVPRQIHCNTIMPLRILAIYDIWLDISHFDSDERLFSSMCLCMQLKNTIFHLILGSCIASILKMQLLPFFFRNIAIVQKKQYNGCLVGYFHRLEYTYTLPQKKCNFCESIFPGYPGSGSVTQGHEHDQEWFWELPKWKFTTWPLIYNLLQKKFNFHKVAFLLRKSVDVFQPMGVPQKTTVVPVLFFWTMAIFLKKKVTVAS